MAAQVPLSQSPIQMAMDGSIAYGRRRGVPAQVLIGFIVSLCLIVSHFLALSHCVSLFLLLFLPPNRYMPGINCAIDCRACFLTMPLSPTVLPATLMAAPAPECFAMHEQAFLVPTKYALNSLLVALAHTALWLHLTAPTALSVTRTLPARPWLLPALFAPLPSVLHSHG